MKRPPILFLVIVLASFAVLHAQGNPYSTGPIQGEVHLPNGQPAANVYLKLEPEGAGGLIQSASTDPAGHFAFVGGGIGAGGNYVIEANVQGYAPVHRLVMVTGPTTYVFITLVALHGKKRSKASVISVRKLQIPPKALEQYEKGLRVLEQGKRSEAEKAFKKAIEIYPQYVESYLRLSTIYADRTQFDEAEKAIDDAAKIGKSRLPTLAYLGYLYMKEKQPEKAELSFRKSIQVKPMDWFAQLELGRLLYNRKDYAGALPHFELARNLRPRAASTHLMVYNDLIRLDRLREALAELDDFVAHFPKNPQAARMRKVRKALAAAAAKEH
jgi:tetratricopeptide (TPR) repeat protein